MQYRFISSNIFYLLEFSFDSRYWYSTPRNILWGEYSSGRRVSEIHVTSFCRYGMLYINQVRCISSLLLSLLLSFFLCIFLPVFLLSLHRCLSLSLHLFFLLFLFLHFFLSFPLSLQIRPNNLPSSVLADREVVFSESLLIINLS